MSGGPLANMDEWFRFHPATEQTGPLHDAIRRECLATAQRITELTPPSAEQTLAVRKLQEAMIFANAAVAIHGPPQRDTDEG